MGIARTLAVVALTVAAALAVYSLAGGSKSPSRPGAQLLVNAKRGDVALKNSLRGRPIVTAQNVAPGTTVSGRIAVRNTGTQKLALRLARRNLVDTPGPSGGLLSEALQIRVDQLPPRKEGRRGAPRQLFRGGLGSLLKLRLRPLAAGAKRVYVFEVSMPDGGTPSSPTDGDNAYQDSSTSVDFVWLGSAKR